MDPHFGKNKKRLTEPKALAAYLRTKCPAPYSVTSHCLPFLPHVISAEVKPYAFITSELERSGHHHGLNLPDKNYIYCLPNTTACMPKDTNPGLRKTAKNLKCNCS